MYIRRLLIENFRCIRALDIPLSATTVLIGENNAGKTAILDAVKIALGRRWGRTGQTGFNEYDFPFDRDANQPRPDIKVKLWLVEATPKEWPQPLLDELNDIVRTDPITGLNSICMQVTCSFESVTKSVDPVWQFVNEDDQPYSGAGARNQNLSRFFDYLPCYSMAAMRDASVEFASRSRFWGSLLKTIEVDDDVAADLEMRFSSLNNELLAADPKLELIKETLRSISSVIANGAARDVDVRAIPVNLWEIISKAEVMVQGRAQDPWLPIAKHGQGVQSLAVIFLFRAYVENALAAAMHEETEPVLTLEEPEAHLHPQACRSLWEAIRTLPGQKLVTTHSPYFVQNVPFKDIVVVRRDAGEPTVSVIPHDYCATVPYSTSIQAVIAKASQALQWDVARNRLTCKQPISEELYRDLLQCYVDGNRSAHHASIRAMKDASRRLISAEEISKLESWAKRIRGEIFFAAKWLLCEGQAEYAVLGAVAEKLGCPLDAHGIALIDYQNNGSPGAFAALARALDYPWAMICDGDNGGDDHIDQLRSHYFSEAEIADHVTQLNRGVDLERLIVTSALRPRMLAAVRQLDPRIPDEDEALLKFSSGNKEVVAVRVASQIRGAASRDDMPDEFRRIFVRIGACE